MLFNSTSNSIDTYKASVNFKFFNRANKGFRLFNSTINNFKSYSSTSKGFKDFNNIGNSLRLLDKGNKGINSNSANNRYYKYKANSNNYSNFFIKKVLFRYKCI